MRNCFLALAGCFLHFFSEAIPDTLVGIPWSVAL